MINGTWIELSEYKVIQLPRDQLSQEMGETIWRKYTKYVDIEFPSIKTNWEWEMRSRGWIGYLPITGEMGLVLLPKVQLKNLFGMLEYVYQINQFKILDSWAMCETIQDFYNFLAHALSRKVLERAQKGFYRSYKPFVEKSPFIIGRIDIKQLITQPWNTTFSCNYEEHTFDVEENQILTWTLYKIMQSGLCKTDVQTHVRNAYQILKRITSLRPFNVRECQDRVYNRLNRDYRIMHMMCRFFLDQSGPTFQWGEHTMFPFIINMASLFEVFVAEWLRVHLPERYILRRQESFSVGKGVRFTFDITIYDKLQNCLRFILDTKYKTDMKPSTKDINQVTTYALSRNCPETILVYPTETEPFDIHIGDIRIRTLTFSLDNNLEVNGDRFLVQLLNDS